MTFTSTALDAHHKAARPIGVGNIFRVLSWRTVVCMRFCSHVGLFMAKISYYYPIWLVVRSASIVLSWYDKSDFLADYCAAWRQQSQTDLEIIVFIDNGSRLAIPCPRDLDDRSLLWHIRIFYDLIRARGGLFELLGPTSSERIDILKLENGDPVGPVTGPPLALGKHGPYGRQIYHFKDPSRAEGIKVGSRLLDEGVMMQSGAQECALNIVRSWDPYATTVIVLVPVGLSLVISVLWSALAIYYFKQEAQASTQAGFTIGGYVVTAGTLLVALVAFLDTKYKTGLSG
ncbi:hypothetical protein K458DRAFT_315415 [Lentithecium fluviatile CBS 122367]|uniref:Uncharacterized protein n=1 Tax=Lentithecium fluviatile CBS 122367 TaxID=1168545 RepID=A0A6G1IM21_9PLEO|nr:hypothetical protein K458DRAFT_315415 [Lentithecium fluviatile CBS 122367]